MTTEEPCPICPILSAAATIKPVTVNEGRIIHVKCRKEKCAWFIVTPKTSLCAIYYLGNLCNL